MSERSEMNEVYKHYLELSTPTEEDLKRVFTDEELKELCLRQKCRVNIWKWNVVDDYRVLFTQSGRYQRWSERDRLRMLAKAVNKIRPTIYTEEEIKKSREEYWKFQLKDNILSLDYWKRERAKKSRTQSTEPDWLSELDFDRDSINSQRQELDNPVINRNEPEVLEKNISNEATRNGEKLITSQNMSQASEIDLMNSAEYMCISDDDSEGSVETVLINENHEENTPEIVESDKVATEILNKYNINTNSMSISLEMCTESQEMPALQSENAIPANYQDFENIIHMTSTQSQSQETTELIVP